MPQLSNTQQSSITVLANSLLYWIVNPCSCSIQGLKYGREKFSPKGRRESGSQGKERIGQEFSFL